MSKQIYQVRYYKDNDSRNEPSGLTMAKLKSGSAFSGKLPIVQLGIQTLPGTKFYLNNSTSYVMVGVTGVYELELEGTTEITSLTFSADSLKMIADQSDSYLIVDIIYEKEDT